ncbi:MAG: amino acid adenylation domain-containing protein [Candidatus Aminicenantes bacterium]|nr:MAG: amino acid adenylation domain-containing protein [Candidatus Aminicenantes bacterium]
MKEINASKENLHVGEQFFKEKEYWLDKLSGEFVISGFPYDYEGDGTDNLHTGKLDHTFDKKIFSRLMQLRNESDPRLHMIIVAVTDILIHLYTGANDIIVGTTIDKQEAEAEYVNTILPLRNQTRDHMTFKQFLLQVRDTVAGAVENQNYPVEELFDQLMVNDGENRCGLFEVAVLLENLQDRKYLRHIQPAILFSFNRTAGSICMELEYKASLYKKDTIGRILEHFKRLLEMVIFDIDIQLSSIDILSPEEKQELIIEFNNTAHDYSDQKAVHELFADQAGKNPGAAALILDDSGGEVSYRELNTKANRLAKLLKTRGVKKETIVGFILQPSPEAVIGILGILKAGGAYLPIDPGYPLQRIRYMLEDSKAMAILAVKAYAEKVISPHPLILLDDENIPGEDGANPEMRCDLASAAYLIYTSGTTGNPKGVLIQHGSLVNYIRWAARTYVQNEKANFPLYTSIAFDLTVTSIFTPLITGNSIVVYQGEDREFLVEKIFNGNNAAVVKLTPVHLMLMSNRKEQEPTIRRFIVGGERLETPLAQKITANFNGNIEIYNEYGPTEATVGCMIYRFKPRADDTPSVPIGIPADNMEIYLLDMDMRNVPPGCMGELYISGHGLARGYLNKPGLTVEQFIPNPFKPGKRMFKTGDRARRLADGNIEFLGRVDQQVKIRGYRIETSEVEYYLSKFEGIRQSLVLVKEDEKGYNSLAAYIVPSGPNIEVGELRHHLSLYLPEFMIPSYFVQLDKLPITPNGKVDRKSLAAIDQSSMDMGENYCPPTCKSEKIMVDVWQEVMGIERIGTADNYFNMGGDSIKAIQISSRLLNYELKLDISDLFQYPTIKELTPHMKPLKQEINQEVVEGEVKLTPIQKWFFQKKISEMHHFNLPVMVYRPGGFNKDILEKVFQKLAEHHDALRMVYLIEDEEIKQVNRGIQSPLYELIDMEITGESYEKIIEEKCNQIQASMDLSRGPLLKLGLFKTIKGDYLLIAIHHLLVDTVSLSILFEDFTSLYQQMENGVKAEDCQLPLKTSSYKEWAEKLYEYANSETMLKELKYWQNLEKMELSPLSKNKDNQAGKSKNNGIKTFELSEQYTEKLLKRVNKAYNTEINDILLAGLSLALSDWTGLERIPVVLEGHGREDIIPDVNITRTVGWFTSVSPVILGGMRNKEDISSVIKNTKDMLRDIPNKGIGYGILKYLTNEENKQSIEFRLNPEVSFNYLGQTDEDLSNPLFQVADISSGNSISPLNTQWFYSLYITGMVRNKRLRTIVKYCPGDFEDNDIQSFVTGYEKYLRQIIDHCASREDTEFTRSDFTSSIEEQELELVFDILGGNTTKD